MAGRMAKPKTTETEGPAGLLGAADKTFEKISGVISLILNIIMINNFGEKARAGMPSRKGAAGPKITKRPPRDPHQEFIDAFHFMEKVNTKEVTEAFKKFCPDFTGNNPDCKSQIMQQGCKFTGGLRMLFLPESNVAVNSN